MINLAARLGDFKCRQRFVFIRQLAADALLGMTFINEHVLKSGSVGAKRSFATERRCDWNAVQRCTLQPSERARRHLDSPNLPQRRQHCECMSLSTPFSRPKERLSSSPGRKLLETSFRSVSNTYTTDTPCRWQLDSFIKPTPATRSRSKWRNYTHIRNPYIWDRY